MVFYISDMEVDFCSLMFGFSMLVDAQALKIYVMFGWRGGKRGRILMKRK